MHISVIFHKNIVGNKMKVPLWAEVNKNKLIVVNNSKVKNVEYPFKPYLFSKKNASCDGGYQKVVKKISIHSMQEEEIYQYTFNNPYNFLKATKFENIFKKYPNGMSLKDLLFVERENFILDYGNTDELRKMVLDIEVLTKGEGRFPEADSNSIFAIGVSCNGEYKCFYTEKENDKDLLKEFLEYFKEKDPDVLAGYNFKKFDLPYIIRRCQINNLDYSCFKRVKNYWNDNANFAGRVLIDLFFEVKSDLSVRGLSNNKLETVGRHFGYETVEMSDKIKQNVIKYYDKEKYKKKIKKYLYNDVELCRLMLEENYLLGKKLLAETLKVPLNDVVISGTSFVPKIFCNRLMKKENLVAYQRNDELPYYYGRYEGGKVRSYINKKYFKNQIYHYDFASLYPSIMLTFNMSPDSVSFLRKEKSHLTRVDLESMKVDDYLKLFTFNDTGPSINFTFPDAGEDQVRMVTVNILKKEGYLSKGLKPIYKQRQELKKEYVTKKRAGQDYNLEFSKQYMFKTIINSSYGFNGSDFTIFGEYLLGPTVTAIGRYLISLVEKFLGQETVIEIDTDGLYSEKSVDKKEVDFFVNKKLKEKFYGLVKESFISVDKDNYKSGYFYKSKNYILLDENDKLKIKGNSLKSSRNCRVVKKVLDQLIPEVIVEQQKISRVYKKFYDFSKYSLEDFALKVSIGMDMKDYKNDNALACKLGKQLQKHTGELPSQGRQIYYYVCGVGKAKTYKIKDVVKSKSELNFEYYRNEIKKILDRFALEEHIQRTLYPYIEK